MKGLILKLLGQMYKMKNSYIKITENYLNIPCYLLPGFEMMIKEEGEDGKQSRQDTTLKGL